MSALAVKGYAPGMSGLQRRRVRRAIEEALAPEENPLKRWINFVSGYSEKMAEKVLAYSWGKTSFTLPANMYFCLLRVEATSASESNTLTEANYTGYARLKLDLTKMTVTKAATCKIENEAGYKLENGACTAGSSTIIGWATTEVASGVGSVNMYGTAASTVISTTQTPPVVEPKQLVGELK